MKDPSLELPEDLLARLNKEAKAKQVTKSALLRESLEALLYSSAEPVSCYDFASDLAGALKGLPKDIADSRKHMKGFGE